MAVVSRYFNISPVWNFQHVLCGRSWAEYCLTILILLVVHEEKGLPPPQASVSMCLQHQKSRFFSWFFAELALVTKRPRAASAFAVGDVTLACKFSLWLTDEWVFVCFIAAC